MYNNNHINEAFISIYNLSIFKKKIGILRIKYKMSTNDTLLGTQISIPLFLYEKRNEYQFFYRELEKSFRK